MRIVERVGRAAAAVALACAAALPAAAAATPACSSEQTASATPVRVRAPGATLDLRVADTVAKRATGLMCVRGLAPRTGMIFVFGDGDNFRDFWMKNTLIPLDMVFLSKRGLVNQVWSNVPATRVDTPDEKIPHRDGVGSYVIELSAGEAARAGIRPGTTLDVSAVPPSRE